MGASLDSMIRLSISRDLKFMEAFFEKLEKDKSMERIRVSKTKQNNLKVEKSSSCLRTDIKTGCWEQHGQRREL